MQEVCDAKKARGGVMMTQRCGKRARIDSIAERILRCHIEAIVLPRAFHGTVNHAWRAGYFLQRNSFTVSRTAEKSSVAARNRRARISI
jgi:hypothetical protein